MSEPLFKFGDMVAQHIAATHNLFATHKTSPAMTIVSTVVGVRREGNLWVYALVTTKGVRMERVEDLLKEVHDESEL